MQGRVASKLRQPNETMSWPGVPRYAGRSVQRIPRPLCRVSRQLSIVVETSAPEWVKGGEWAALEAARSNTRGSGWAPSGPASPRGERRCQPEL